MSADMAAAATGDRRPAPLNVHLQQLAYLREVGRRGSISAAAEVLHVSQPALSQALAELGRRLNVPIFERAGRGRRLTAAGQEVLRYAEETLTGAEALGRRLALLRDGEGGTLNAGMIDAASLYVLPEVVRRYRAAHPGVDLKLVVDTSSELLRRLRAFELDLAFVVGPVPELDLTATEVLREPLHIYTPPDEEGDPRAARWVLYPQGSRTRRIIDAAFARFGIEPAVVLESGNPAVLRQMVAMGLGWSVLPPAIAEAEGPGAAGDEAAPAGLQRGERLAERPLHVAQRRDGPPDPRAEAFLALALDRHDR
jgi:DNA-binding transcriptional LysR family regulator